MSNKSLEVIPGYGHKIKRANGLADESKRLNLLFERGRELGMSAAFLDCARRQLLENEDRANCIARNIIDYGKNHAE